jgi:hypothetical protein
MGKRSIRKVLKAGKEKLNAEARRVTEDRGEKRSRRCVNDSLDASIFQWPGSEIQEEADRESREAEIAGDLGEMSVAEAIDGLDLHNDLVVHHQIHDVGIGNTQSFKGDVQTHFQPHLMPIKPKGMSQTHFVGLFKQTWPQGFLDPNRSTKDGFGDIHVRMFISLLIPPMARHTSP